jgi:hypothetical protein
LREKEYSYDYNQAMKALRAYVTRNPRSFGGIITTGDIGRVKYSVYVA